MTGQGRAGRFVFLALPFFYCLLLTEPFLAGQEVSSALPRIQRLDNRDTAFVQYIYDVESARRQIFVSAEKKTAPENLAQILTIYSYTAAADDNILTLSARCNIPYSSIATINRLAGSWDLKPGMELLLPSVPGLFIPEEPENELEFLLLSSRGTDEGIIITVNTGTAKFRCRFLPGLDFNSTERIFFLDRGFVFPLLDYRITSTFGPRQNPVTGIYGNHQGLDLAAPQGTPVYASREGRISEQGEDSVYGNYIIISHGDTWVSLYGHLSEIMTVLHQQVNSGSLIGKVGSTGQSTGPHLHFEIRQNGRAQDPGKLLRVFQGN